MSGNTTTNPNGNSPPLTSSVYDIVIDTVAVSTVTDPTATPPTTVTAYTVYFTDPVAVNTAFTDGYILQVDGEFHATPIPAMSGKGIVAWIPATSGQHMLAIWDGQGRHSAPYPIVTP